VSRGRSNACNPLAPQIDKNLGNPMVKKVYVCTLADRRWIRLLSVNNGPICHLFELIFVIHAKTSNGTNHIV
jgi:hypothetical protein